MILITANVHRLSFSEFTKFFFNFVNSETIYIFVILIDMKKTKDNHDKQRNLKFTRIGSTI
jgi:hypothetical protein